MKINKRHGPKLVGLDWLDCGPLRKATLCGPRMRDGERQPERGGAVARAAKQRRPWLNQWGELNGVKTMVGSLGLVAHWNMVGGEQWKQGRLRWWRGLTKLTIGVIP